MRVCLFYLWGLNTDSKQRLGDKMFEKLVSFTKDVSDLADKPALNPADLKAHFDAAPNEVREYLNKLIDALKKTELGDSGAKNIGATAITGLTGTDVQSLLESMKTYADGLIVSGSNSNGSYIKYPDGTLVCYSGVYATAGTGLKTISGITYPDTFIGAPNVQVTHRSLAGKFANYYVLDPTTTAFGIVHQGVGNIDLNGTIFTWQAIGKWK